MIIGTVRGHLHKCVNVQVRQLAAICLKKNAVKLWIKLAPDVQEHLKTCLLTRIAQVLTNVGCNVIEEHREGVRTCQSSSMKGPLVLRQSDVLQEPIHRVRGSVADVVATPPCTC